MADRRLINAKLLDAAWVPAWGLVLLITCEAGWLNAALVRHFQSEDGARAFVHGWLNMQRVIPRYMAELN
jgi:hypothetical protein